MRRVRATATIKKRYFDMPFFFLKVQRLNFAEISVFSDNTAFLYLIYLLVYYTIFFF